MVKSGLVNVTTVSHYRLSIHLSIALIIISLIFWLLLNLRNKTLKIFFQFKLNNLPFLFFVLFNFFTNHYWCFCFGTWCWKHLSKLAINGKFLLSWWYRNKQHEKFFDFDNQSLVQFYHRNLAYLISCYIIILSILIFIKNLKALFKPLKILIFFFTLQFFLGIFTLVSGLNIYLALLHQINSLLLIFSTINLYYFSIK